MSNLFTSGILIKGKLKYESLGISIKSQLWNTVKGEVRPNDQLDYNSINKLIHDKVKKGRDSIYKLRAEGIMLDVSKIKEKKLGKWK